MNKRDGYSRGISMSKRNSLATIALVIGCVVVFFACGNEAAAQDVFFRRGDANEDGERDIGDAIAILEKLFFGNDASDCPDVLDANDDGFRDISDVMALLNWLFLGGLQLPDPNDKGQDPSEDDHLCE